MPARALILGGGHNALVCAHHLARAGLRVTLLERRPVLGGATVTEEFHPGFRNSMAAYTVSLLSPAVIQAMDLPRHGLRVVLRRTGNLLPTATGQYLTIGRTPAEDHASIARFSPADAEAWPRYHAALARLLPALRRLLATAPPNPARRLRALPAAWRSLAPLAALDLPAQRDLLALFARSAADWLRDWFVSDPVQALLGFDGIVGTYASPEHPGTAYVLLHHVFGEANGVPGAWGHAIGGMGAIATAMAAAAREAGATLRTDAEVTELLVRNGRVHGIRLATGETLDADLVASGIHPRLLYERLIDPAHLPADFRTAIGRYRSGSASFRMNLALGALPRFPGLPDGGDHLTAGIVLGCPSLAAMHQAHEDARAQGWSRRPIVEMLIPSTLDPTLAPPGRHVASLFCQHFDPGIDWPARRDAAVETILDTVEAASPGFRSLIEGRIALSPLDLEQRFGLVAGDIFHGRLSLDQLFAARPVLGHGDYRGPIRGLYMCGSGTHPGGGVTGLPGHNAARAILLDRRWHRLGGNH